MRLLCVKQDNYFVNKDDQIIGPIQSVDLYIYIYIYICMPIKPHLHLRKHAE